MIKVTGLPVQITKADLDELFKPYGKIQVTENSVLIESGETGSTAYVVLDQNEQLAIAELSGQRWRESDRTLYLDEERGDERVIGSRGSVRGDDGERSATVNRQKQQRRRNNRRRRR